MALALPMEIVGPVVGIGAILTSIVASIAAVSAVISRLPSPRDRARGLDLAERDQVIEDLRSRVAEFEQVKEQVVELEERLDFAERLLAQQRETPRIGPGTTSEPIQAAKARTLSSVANAATDAERVCPTDRPLTGDTHALALPDARP